MISLSAFLYLGWIQYRAEVQRQADTLSVVANKAARRVSAEVLLGSAGEVQPVSTMLKTQYDLHQVVLLPSTPHACAKEASSCWVVERELLVAYSSLPVSTGQWISISAPAPRLAAYLKPSLLIWSGIPLFLLLTLGLLLQKRLLGRYVVEPVENLVSTATTGGQAPEHWPKEFQQISGRLADSFQQREQAVFGQLAKGVIHDVKTLLHSLMTASDLASEPGLDPEKSQKRSAMLLRASQTNLPKMRAIIEETLDGSREISVSRTGRDLRQPIQSSIHTLKELAYSRGIEVRAQADELKYPHDPVQLERALTNLVKNAIEAFDELAAKEASQKRIVEITAAEDADKVSISIEDSGPGIRDQKKILRPLQSTKPHGYGIGLLVTRKIIEAHGGSLNVGTSRALGGASFEVVFPKGGNPSQGGVS